MLGRGQVNQNPLSHITGAFIHCAQWVTSSTNDLVYQNPQFNTSLKDQAVSIYCVHGTADRCNAFKILVEGLIARGLPDHIASIHLCSFEQRYKGIGIPQFAEQLAGKIIANQHTRVILMGHSRGGVVCAYLAEKIAAEKNITVQEVFGFASPFSGSELAMKPLTLISQSVDEMRPDSPLLAELREKIDANERRYHFFAAEKDALVPLHSTHIATRAHHLTVLHGEGHLSMMTSPVLVDHVLERLVAPPVLSIETICAELRGYIDGLKQKSHVWSADEKVTLLERLYSQLHARDFSVYPDARTVSEFINAFLQDTRLTASGKPPSVILNASLNFPFSFYGNSTSFNYVTQLMVRYAAIPLAAEVVLASEISNTQIQSRSV